MQVASHLSCTRCGNEQVNDRWEICISMSEGQFSQVSWHTLFVPFLKESWLCHIPSRLTHCFALMLTYAFLR
jgi:hypothetical protein